MKLVKLGSLALVLSMVVASASGCVIRAHGRVGGPVVFVDEEPPPPRVWVTDVRPGFVFVQGHWERRGGQWIWMDGYWERQRVGYVWNDGYWDRRGNRHVWVQGRWSAGGQVQPARGQVRGNGNVRDHRRNNPPPPPPQQGPVIRDHRR